jgi:hypothetical protein
MDQDTENLVLSYDMPQFRIHDQMLEFSLPTIKVCVNLQGFCSDNYAGQFFSQGLDVEIIPDPNIGANHEYSYVARSFTRLLNS